MWGIMAKARNPRDEQIICVGMHKHVTPMKTKGDIMFNRELGRWVIDFYFPYKFQKDAKKEFKLAKEMWVKQLLSYDTFHPTIIKELK